MLYTIGDSIEVEIIMGIIDKINPVSSTFLVNDTSDSLEKKKKLRESEAAVSVSTADLSVSIKAALDAKPVPELPDLQAIAERIRGGSYHMNYEKIADKLIELDSLWYR